MKKGIGVAGLGLFAVATAGAAHADLLYATRGDRLYRIDTDTLSSEEVGSTGLGTIVGLARGSDGMLYGLGAFSGLLARIDPETAAGEIVATLDVPVSLHSGLACDRTTGFFYAISSQGAGAASFLVAISPESYLASPVADTPGVALIGLGADAEGNLYGLDGAPSREELVRIDKQTGALTPLLSGGLRPFRATSALDVGPTGRVWTINNLGASYELVEVDPNDGFPTSHGPIEGLVGSGSISGLASEALAGMQVLPPAPDRNGAVSTVPVTGAQPGSQVLLVYGTRAGSKRVPRCGGSVDVAPPYLFKVRRASAEGVAEFRVPVRPGIEGLTVLMQAFELGTCAKSPVTTVTF